MSSTSDPAGRHLSFPFSIGADGRTAAPVTHTEHVHDELVQLLLTDFGERPFLPEFGGGARKLVFEPTSDVLRGVIKSRLTQSINKWMGHRLTLENLEVSFTRDLAKDSSDEETKQMLRTMAMQAGGELVSIAIKYRAAGSDDSRVIKFQRAVK